MHPSRPRRARSRRPTSTIGEVAYQDEGKRLSVAVAGDLSKDGLVSDILTGILATAQRHGEAVRQIHAVSEELGWQVRIDNHKVVDVVTLDPTDADTRY